MNKKTYVFPKCKDRENEMQNIDGIARLFAFPNKPNIKKNNITILDSGAYNLFKNGGYIDKGYMSRLSYYYEKYANYSDEVMCVAPDMFLNPMQSMFNIRKWFKNFYYGNVAAILQCDRKNYVDIEYLKQQVDYYLSYTNIIFFSNNNLTGEQAKMFHLEELFKYMKEQGVVWIHVLGAGWNLKDIRDWCSIDYFDSLDSIAYYATKDIKEYGSFDAIENVKNIVKLMEDINNGV